MIKPLLQHDALLADIAAARADTGRVHLWWLGQSGFLVQSRGKHMLFDPYLSDSLTTKYASTDKPHVRMTELVIDPAKLDFIDVVSSSHNHTDHLDAETLGALRRVNPQMKIVVPEANRAFAAERLKMDAGELIGMDDGVVLDVARFLFHGVPAAHDAVERDERGHHKYMGYVVRFATGISPPRVFTIYHAGDTLLYDGMVERLRPFKIDVAILPISGRGPERRVAGNLWGREAARLAYEIGARVAIPCHYEMFTFNTASPEEFVTECARLGQEHRVMRNGERVSFRVSEDPRTKARSLSY